jgi:GTPase SAR1 family protein
VTDLAYDVAFQRMEALAAEIGESLRTRNEATTRLQFIDRLLFDCLGWSSEEAELEDHQDGEYADYVLDRRARVLVVEAKKEGATFQLPPGLAPRSQLKALFNLGGEISNALEQVEHYAQARGTPYAAICNGHQLVAFVASRQDGLAPRSGRAIVFDGPDAMVDRFSDLWQALARAGVETRRMTAMLSASSSVAPPRLSESIVDYPGTAAAGERQLMLGTLSSLFLPDYVRDDQDETRFLEECYSPPGAYSRLALLSRGLLRTRYSMALGEELKVGLREARDRDGLNPALLEQVAASSAGRDPIVLLGGVGVGKTMFLRRLLRVDAKEISDDAVQLYVDLGRSAVLEDLRPYIVSSFREQLYDRYGIDIDAAEFLRGTYHAEVRRFARGVNSALVETDATEFKRREIDHLLELAARTEDHLRRSLEHLVKLRGQQIIVVLDNIDQRSRDDQEQVFLIAETMAKSWPCTVFVTLRPETFNASRVRGTLTGYQPLAFTVEPPRVERAVVKRLEFGAKYLAEDGRLPTWLGWTSNSSDLPAYVSVLLKSMVRSDPLQEALINLSGGNTRRALELMTTFVTSPHGEHETTLERNETGVYLVPPHAFLRAVMLGEARFYDPRNSRIPNLFDVSGSLPGEHFLLPCILGMALRAASNLDGAEGFVQVEDVYTTFQDLAFEVDHIDFAISRALASGLIEGIPPEQTPRAIRASTIGAYAHRALASSFPYLDLVVVDTPIGDAGTRAQLRVVHAIRQRLDRVKIFLSYLDAAWAGSTVSEAGLFDWMAASSTVRTEVEAIAERL